MIPTGTTRGSKYRLMGKFVFRIQSCVCLVVPSSVMPNGRIGILLGQRGAIDRIIYKSVPRANLNGYGESLPPTIWGDIVVEEYIDLYNETHRF